MNSPGDVLSLIAGIVLAGAGIAYLIGAFLLHYGHAAMAKHIGPTVRGNLFRGFACLLTGLAGFGRRIVPERYAETYSWLFVAAVVVFTIFFIAGFRDETPAGK